MAFNGAEPVLIDTLTTFAERFAPCGLDPRALAPVYGLAEADARGRVHPGRPGAARRAGGPRRPRARTARGAGGPGRRNRPPVHIERGPDPGFEVRTVDDGGRETPERVEGRLQFRGPSTTSGYYRDPPRRPPLRRGMARVGRPRLRRGGEVFITGRVKDVVSGPDATSIPTTSSRRRETSRGPPWLRGALLRARTGGTAAAGTERLVVVAETRESDLERRAEIRTALEALSRSGSASRWTRWCSPAAHRAQDLERQDPRRAMADLYESGELGATRAASRPLWLRLARSRPAARGPPCEGGRDGLARSLAGWVWGVLALVGAIPALAAIAARRPRFGFGCARAVGRIVFRLAGVRLTVEGAEHLVRDGAFVIASNHASYSTGSCWLQPSRARSVSSRRRSCGTTSSPAGFSTDSAPSMSTASTSREASRMRGDSPRRFAPGRGSSSSRKAPCIECRASCPSRPGGSWPP